MKSPIGLVLVLLMAFAGCSSARDAATNAPSAESRQLKAATTAQTETIASQNAEFQEVSLTRADTAASAAEAADRKIIRNANLTMEVKSTSDMQHKVTSIAESHGGFVVTSESKQREDADPEKRTLDIKLVVRVPSERFGSALDQIRGLANTLREENVTGQDVTEEFIDLEARIRTQRALELQFLEIMKQARKVEDALEVQRQIADVRTDIEKLEGRKRFLENRASLSTIVVALEGPRQIVVNTTTFGRSLREAVAEGVDLGSAILLLLVRFVIIMVPVTVFVLLPLGLLFRYFVRRAKRIQLAEALSTPSGS
ncbi:MAG TPA: DUF4349 domain-containing protein [Pyrinomonadaceae bacterium]|nr:DUF4349 domain-containing protein [Pyrinomonadaceae bacterium]